MGILELTNNVLQIATLGVLVILISRFFLQKPHLKFLLCFEGAFLCYFLGDIFWTLYFVIKGDFPQYISISDISYVAAYLFLAACAMMMQKEYDIQETTKKDQFWGYVAAAASMVVCLICYLLVGGFFWNLMYALPLAILGYVTAINLRHSKMDDGRRNLFDYHRGILTFVILNNLMFLVSSMGWNNLYICCDFLTTVNFAFTVRFLLKGENL